MTAFVHGTAPVESRQLQERLSQLVITRSFQMIDDVISWSKMIFVVSEGAGEVHFHPRLRLRLHRHQTQPEESRKGMLDMNTRK